MRHRESPKVPLAVLLVLTVLGSTFVFVPAPVNASVGCGSTIKTNTTLTSNIGPCSGTGLVIGANGITLNCNGHAIVGTNTNIHAGIYLVGRTKVTVENCNVAGFRYGFEIIGFPRNTLTGNTADNNHYYGFYLVSTSHNTLTKNIASSNTRDGFVLYSSSYDFLGTNAANSNNHYGFYLFSSSKGNSLTTNTADSNGAFGYSDNSVGSGTGGTANYYSGDECSNNGVGDSTVENWPILSGDPTNANYAPWGVSPNPQLLSSVSLNGGGWVLTSGSTILASATTYWGGPSNRIVAINSITGHPLWTETFGTVIRLMSSGDGLLFVGSNSYVKAVRESTGQTLWTFPVNNGAAATYAGGRVFVNDLNGRMYVLNALTGKMLWSFLVRGSSSSNLPAVAKGVVYTTGWGNGMVYALNAANGAKLWGTSLNSDCSVIVGGCIAGSPVYSSGRLFVGTTGGVAYALNATDGKVLWKFSTSYDTYIEAVAQGVVLTTAPSTSSGDVDMYALNSTSGAVLWQYGPKGFPQYGISVSGSNVIAVTTDGTLHTLSLLSGHETWSYALSGSIHDQVRAIPSWGDMIVATSTTLYVFR